MDKEKPKKSFALFFTKPPKIDRKTWIILALITAVYTVLAFYRLGTTKIPQTTVLLEDKAQSVTVELDEATKISKFCFYKWRGRKNDIKVYVSSNNDWTLVYSDELSSHMRWKNIAINSDEKVKYIKIIFEGKEITLAEIVVLDKLGVPVDITVPESMNETWSYGNDLSALTDERELFDPDSSSLTFAFFDEYLYGLTSNAYIHGGTGLENTHPALGKVVIMFGIMLFGMNSIGWRFFGTLSGIIMLPVMFLLARRVLRSNHWGLVATLLLSLEFMHYSQTRLATIDSFPLLFILLAYLFMMRYLQSDRLRGELLSLFLSGLSWGIACAFKWIGIYAGLGLATCFFAFFFSKYNRQCAENLASGKEPPRLFRRILATFPCCILFFIIIPAAVYVASYIPAAFGPFADIKGWSGIWENQKYMYNFHSTLTQTFDFSSPWWSWPFMMYPICYLRTYSTAGQVSSVIAMGNPMIWWFSVYSVIVLVFMFIFGRSVKSPLLPGKGIYTDVYSSLLINPAPKKQIIERFDAGYFMILVAYLCQYVPWMLVSRQLFIYHYFASASISVMATAALLRFISSRYSYGTRIAKAYIIVTAIFFILYFPIMNGFFIDTWYMNILNVLF